MNNPKKMILIAQNQTLLLIFFAGILVSLFNYYNETRLHFFFYIFFGVMQCLNLSQQIVRRNFMACIWGASFTLMLLLAVSIETAQYLEFNFVLSRSVYTINNINKAYNVLLFSGSIYHLLTLKFLPSNVWIWPSPDLSEKLFARKYMWFVLALGVILCVLTLRGHTILTTPYASHAMYLGKGLIQSSGMSLLSIYFLCFSLVVAARNKGYGSHQYKMMLYIVLFVATYFLLLRGDRGGMLAIFTTIGLLYYFNSSSGTWRKIIVMAVCLVCLFLFYSIWGYVRAYAFQIGLLESLVRGWNRFFSQQSSGFDPLGVTLLPQSYWHLLHTIDLYEKGISLAGRTFVDLIPQSIPKFITDAVGYERPINGAWRLAAYRLHGGGMYVVALGFWNFGLMGAGIIGAALALITIKLETWYQSQEPILACTYFAVLGTFGFSIFYGLQPFVKALEIAIIMAIFFKYLMKKYRAKARRVKKYYNIVQALDERHI